MRCRKAKIWIKEEMNIEMPEGRIDGEWFFKHNFPMIVACKCCEATMILPNALIDDEGNIYCPSCADEG